MSSSLKPATIIFQNNEVNFQETSSSSADIHLAGEVISDQYTTTLSVPTAYLYIDLDGDKRYAAFYGYPDDAVAPSKDKLTIEGPTASTTTSATYFTVKDSAGSIIFSFIKSGSPNAQVTQSIDGSNPWDEIQASNIV